MVVVEMMMIMGINNSYREMMRVMSEHKQMTKLMLLVLLLKDDETLVMMVTSHFWSNPFHTAPSCRASSSVFRACLLKCVALDNCDHYVCTQSVAPY